MMNSNNNFLLKIHMEEEGNLTEIFLNKERHSFTFLNEECIADLTIPEFKVTNVNMILENKSDTGENDSYYVEYEKNGETIREYDSEKIELIRKMITENSISDFLDYLNDIKINNYYIDNVVDSYNCVLPNDIKKILSYTTNGVVFSGVDRIYMLPHNEIVEYKGTLKNFIPIMIKNDKNYIGYDYKDSLYKEYEYEKVINEKENLRELFNTEEKEEKVITQTKEKVIDEQNYEDTIKNIDYQFEKLNTGIVQKKGKEEINIKDKVKKKSSLPDDVAEKAKKIIEKIKAEDDRKKKAEEKRIQEENERERFIIEQEIIEGVRKSLSQIEETNAIIDEIDNNIEQTQQEDIQEDFSLVDLVNASLLNTSENYKINFNDTQKLIVEHLPYYEITSGFDVIQIPEIEIDKLTLLPNSEINLGKIKMEVESISNSKVDLVVKSATSIVDKNDNKLKKGDHVLLDLTNEVTFRLNKKGTMETWSLRMEKSTFEKELRNIDYSKIMNKIIKLDSYKRLGNIEKFELQKSIMLFIHFVMEYKEDKKLYELYRILEEEPTLYEEYVTRYNIKHAEEKKDSLQTYDYKKEYVIKLNYINGLIEAEWLDYPRYIFRTQKYYDSDDFLEEFIYELEDFLSENDFSDYLKKLFKEYKMFTNLDEVGRENLNKCLEYLSVLYKYNPSLGESIKYKIEKEFMIGAGEEDIALLISKLCRRGIKDYAAFIEYDAMMKEAYRLGNLKYPIFSESFGIEEIRNGGEYDEY